MAKVNTADVGFEKQIWNAADVLRGSMDAAEYKHVVLGLIFLKYISDRFEAKYQELVRVEELCEMTASVYKNPQSYEDLLTEFGIADKKKTLVKELSGGERQRLFIVLALIPNPEVVFLDELTTGLDARARREVWNILLKLKKQGLSILLTSHFMDEVEALCDEILILKKGKTVFHGTVEEAKSQSGKSGFEDAYLWFTDEEDSYESI